MKFDKSFWLFIMVVILGWWVVTVHDSNKLLKKENSELIDSIQNYEKRINSLHELDTKHTQELTNAKAEIDKLRIAAERNPERVYIKASCKKAEGTTATGLDDAITARPTDTAIRNYWLLRERIAESEQMIKGLQEYVKNQCISAN
ncbi:lysis protein [Providencia stuartii]|uniref:Phage endopeptidase n=1 Tax=Providencia stuartii (strain MRSN 2154) TaxID=1157951 RepID=A0A140NUE3_PROSM|nr:MULTISPECIES: lysis protein [Providencia]AFH95562.1 phage endopeptidase [Providencia stuartii MRSN 2154]MDE8745137.1 lysis protein [Providencia thailandensis]MDE8764632.1 lysis protein [Providencia thailandensis]MDE8777135.1 lysis protein [Providencia thailandensis]MDE8781124.1 lysis protein [Providencia thailandensis]